MVSNELTDAQIRLRPAGLATRPQAADELLALDKQIADLELQLEALRSQRRPIWVARLKEVVAEWYSVQDLQDEQEQIRKSQAVAAHWKEHQEASDWRGSSSSGSGERWAASTWTPSHWNTWADSWNETAWQADSHKAVFACASSPGVPTHGSAHGPARAFDKRRFAGTGTMSQRRLTGHGSHGTFFLSEVVGPCTWEACGEFQLTNALALLQHLIRGDHGHSQQSAMLFRPACGEGWFS
jgi:hypothetical protein